MAISSNVEPEKTTKKFDFGDVLKEFEAYDIKFQKNGDATYVTFYADTEVELDFRDKRMTLYGWKVHTDFLGSGGDLHIDTWISNKLQTKTIKNTLENWFNLFLIEVHFILLLDSAIKCDAR